MIITNRKNCVFVHNKNAEHGETDWLSTKTTQQYVYLQTFQQIELVSHTAIANIGYKFFKNCVMRITDLY